MVVVLLKAWVWEQEQGMMGGKSVMDMNLMDLVLVVLVGMMLQQESNIVRRKGLWIRSRRRFQE
ncbi:hypothetical protein NB721_003989 [Xanthomonas sacchari]|nr:hypothetical protein [Xanthomonas sacchari]